jgi:hypothetical protein
MTLNRICISVLFQLCSLFYLLINSGCMTVRTEHRIEPIHITLDVNLKVQRELDDFFGDLDAASSARSLP